MQVLVMNALPEEERNRATVVFDNTRQCGRVRHFAFDIKLPVHISLDVVALINDIEKLVPNVRVTQAVVSFIARIIIIQAKELGRAGEHCFTFLILNS